MIARLRGKPVARDAEGLVLEVGGVGYRVLATPTAMQKADGADEVVVETHLHVREDALQLYGFADAAERELFEQLLSVSGVGPKVALAIVSGYSPAELTPRDRARGRRALPDDSRHRQEDRRARRARAEGAHRAARRRRRAPISAPATATSVARDALVELGYSPAEAEQRLAETDPDLPPAERVRQALRAA